MNFLFSCVEKLSLGLFALCFSFVCVYTPQVFVAEAGGVCVTATGPCAGELSNTTIAGNTGATAASAAVSATANVSTSASTGSTFLLDNLLDGIAWTLGKTILSQMTSQILKWVNSGFEGSPAFVTDMKGFLLNVSDEVIGTYLDELGGPFSFLCAPFKLDVQVAVAIAYETARSNGGILPPATCSLTGALENLEDFLGASGNFADNGGWSAWLKVSTQPETYTTFGAGIGANIQAQARLVNARGEEIKLLEFGGGFFSNKICEAIEGPSGPDERCSITTPGNVISEALTFQTSSGARTLIEADEINEIIAATFSQLTQKAITGTLGLLGLSPGTGYSYEGTPFTEELMAEGFTKDPESIYELIVDDLLIETTYETIASDYRDRFTIELLDPTLSAEKRTQYQDAVDDINTIRVVIGGNAADLTALRDEINLNRNGAGEINADPAALQSIVERYFDIPIHTEIEMNSNEDIWSNMLR